MIGAGRRAFTLLEVMIAMAILAFLMAAGAVALGLAENRMYWSASSSQCRDYLDALIATGWTPDEWTAATLTDRPDRD